MCNLHTGERTADLVRSIEAIVPSITGEISIDTTTVGYAYVFVPLASWILPNRWTYDVELISHCYDSHIISCKFNVCSSTTFLRISCMFTMTIWYVHLHPRRLFNLIISTFQYKNFRFSRICIVRIYNLIAQTF